MNRFIIADATKCIGCRTCEVACVCRIRRIRIALRCHQTSLFPVFVSLKTTAWTTAVACHQCEDAPCANVCPVDAISREHGHIFVEQSRCIGCKSCMLACPFGAMEVVSSRKKARAINAICAGIGRRDRPVLKPARQRRCSAWMSRKCSGIGYGSSLFETFFPAFLNAGIALSGLQILPNSIYCRNHVGLISVAHLSISSARIFTPASIFSGSGTVHAHTLMRMRPRFIQPWEEVVPRHHQHAACFQALVELLGRNGQILKP